MTNLKRAGVWLEVNALVFKIIIIKLTIKYANKLE